MPKLNQNARTKDSLSEGAIESFLHDKKVPTVVENGGVCPVPLQGMQEGLMPLSTVLMLSHPHWQANEHEEVEEPDKR